eukprot:COSAG02_NODE_2295_length_9197_cov_20.855463_9_plen_85_part_00
MSTRLRSVLVGAIHTPSLYTEGSSRRLVLTACPRNIQSSCNHFDTLYDSLPAILAVMRERSLERCLRLVRTVPVQRLHQHQHSR